MAKKPEHQPKLVTRIGSRGTVKVLTKRNRYDVTVYFPGGGSLRWFSDRMVHVPPAALVKQLREMATAIEKAYTDAG